MVALLRLLITFTGPHVSRLSWAFIVAEGFPAMREQIPLCKHFSSLCISFAILPLAKASLMASSEFVWEDYTGELYRH